MSSQQTLAFDPAALASPGDRPAIIAVGRESIDETSFATLSDQVDELARGLLADGVDHQERIGLFAAVGTSWIVACLGLIRAGAIPVPLDTQIGDDDLLRIIDDADIDRVFADEVRALRLDDVDFDGRTWRLDTDENDERSWRQLGGDNTIELPRLKPSDVALLFFTSGTTGPPKGVPLTHRNLGFQVDAIEATGIVEDTDRLLLPLPLHHVYPLVIGVLVPASMGLPVILPHALTGPEFLRAIRETGATVIAGVPRLYASLIEGLDAQIAGMPTPIRALLRATLALSTSVRRRTGLNPGRWLLSPLRRRLGSTLRLLASGGSPLSGELTTRLEGLGWDVAVGYGLTETAPLLTIRLPDDRRPESVGRALTGVELRIDTDGKETDEELDPPSGKGEILARGPGVFEGYLHLDKETRQSFTDDGWFRTGDLGYLDEDGYLTVLGRKSTMIVTASGENIRTEALEERFEEHALIAEIGILKSGDRLAAVIFPDSGALNRESLSVGPAIEQAVREIGRSLPSYQQLDRYRISEKPLERTRLGKIKRHRLEARYAELEHGERSKTGSPIDIGDMAAEDRKRLKHPAARRTWDLLRDRYANTPMSPDSDFRLELGVDSMGWLDLSMDIAAATGVELEEADIAEIESVRDLLDAVIEGPSRDGVPKKPLEDPEATLTEEQKAWLEPPTAAGRRAAKSLMAINRWLMHGIYRVRAQDTPDTGNGPIVFAPNHTSFLDAFALAAALPPDVLEHTHWGGWTGYTLRNRLFRTVSRLVGVVPVEPERATMSSLAFAVAILEKDRNLVWFPEGQRSKSGELGELRAGIGAILEAVPGARVVPVSIDGAFEAWPVHHRLPRPGHIDVEFGSGLSSGDLADRGSGESERQRIVNGLGKVLAALCQQSTASG